MRRLDEHGQSQPSDLSEHLRSRRAPPPLAHTHVLDLLYARRSHQLLEQHLVHAQRRRRHPGPDICHIERLEHPLHGAVLPERTVQRPEHDVHAEQPRSRAHAQPLALVTPRAVALDLHPQHLVPSPLQTLSHGASGGQRHIVLGRASSGEHRHS